MTVAQMWNVQTAVKAAVDVALAGRNVPVYDHAPPDPPVEFVRLDGFGFADESLKNGERGRHSFMVHYFKAGTRGQKTAKESIIAIAQQLKVTTIAGNQPRLEFVETPTESDQVAHAYARFTVYL